MKASLIKYAVWLVSLIALFSQPVQADDQSRYQLQQWLAGLTSFSAEFEQNVFDTEQKLIQTGQGDIQLQQPNKMRWQSVTPSEVLLVADGETTWYYDVFAEQVSIMNFKQTVASTPFILLSNPSPEVWQDYHVSSTKQGFSIVAKNTDSQVPELRIVLNEQQLVGLEVIDASGQRSEFNFKNSQVNPKLASELFKFTLPEGVDIDDQRKQ